VTGSCGTFTLDDAIALRLLRGLIAAGIKRGTPPEVRDQMMVLDH